MNENVLFRINELLDDFVYKHKKFGLDYVDAILYYAKEYDLDIYDIVDVINENVKEQLKRDFIKRKMLKEEIKELPDFLFKK